MDQLKQDHEFIAEILRRVDELIAESEPVYPPDPTQFSRVRDEIEGLSAILSSHLRYEEKKIVNALNQISDAAVDTTDFLLTGRSII